jgi:hypothetical protein
MRSVSNPEGMEKWDSYDGHHPSSARHYFVLPRSVLEQELASVKLACRDKESLQDNSSSSLTRNSRGISVKEVSPRTFDLDEILKQARSRLSEEMVESLSNAEKGDILLPHLLGKYKEVCTVVSYGYFPIVILRLLFDWGS